jgi:nucleotide-binding universal stress UspA family protein
MIQKILLAIDGSELSGKATAMATQIASKFGSEVVVLHVCERSFGRGGEPIILESDEEARDMVDLAVRALKDSGVSARGEVRSGLYGRAAHEILATADAEDPDLIVMGSRGLSDLKGLLVGSVTHKVLHLGDRPVLVAR